MDVLTRELKETRDQRSATTEVLRIINSQPGSLAPVFEAILQKAHALCGADDGSLQIYDGENVRAVAVHGVTERFAKLLREGLSALNSPASRASFEGQRYIQINDAREMSHTILRAAAELTGTRTILYMPLRMEGRLLGFIAAARREVKPFSENEIGLLENFAAQAVIAIENARLFNQTQEALERQTATADILKVIAGSPTNVQPVFDAIATSAKRLLASHTAVVTRVIDGVVHLAASTAESEAPAHAAQGLLPYPLSSDRIHARVARTGRIAVNTDAPNSDLPQEIKEFARKMGWRSMLVVPMLRNEVAIGTIGITRRDAGAFDDKTVDLLKTFADQAVIAIENARLFNETQEALERQTATAEVLNVINSSPGELAPVFETILEKAHSLCGVSQGSLLLYEGEKFRAVAVHGIAEAFADRLRQGFVPGPNHPSRQLLKGARFAQVPDCAEIDDPVFRAAVEIARIRTVLFIPLRREGNLLGQIAAARRDVRPFTEKEVSLLENFAAQAVIAMENARLLNETAETLERQTATADILKVIASSPDNVRPVFEAIAQRSKVLVNALSTTVFTLLNGAMHLQAFTPTTPQADAKLRATFPAPLSTFSWGEAIAKGEIYRVVDAEKEPERLRELARERGWRSALLVPLMRDGEPIGMIGPTRAESGPFTEHHVQLMQTFADQAVIAIRNVELFEEVQASTRDLQESLRQQTATADLLQVISRSAFDLQPIFDAIAERAVTLCGADRAFIFRFDGELLRMAAAYNAPPDFREWVAQHPIRPGRHSASARAALERRTIHIHDVRIDTEYTYGAKDAEDIRTVLGVPILKGDELLGVMMIYHLEGVRPFTEKQIALVETFADQAAIAIENVRLFNETRESLERQTATTDVLKVISQSSVDLETVLETLVQTVARLCRADQVYMFHLRHDLWHLIADCGLSREASAFFRTNPFTPGRGSTSGRAALERRAVQIADVLQDPEYTLSEGQQIAGYRSTLGIPLLREDTLVGVYSICRTRVEPFTEKEIELATSFADQAVIAIENARLFDELRDRQAELRVTFDNMGDGVAMFGADSRLAAWNRNFQEMLDLPDELLIARPRFAELFRFLTTRGEFGSADLQAELGRSLEDTTKEMRYERTRPDGRVIEVRRNSVPEGGFVLIYADITERKRSEEAIRAARDAAEKALRDLQAAQDRLIQTEKLASLGQLTAGIAHEIKNPLNFVNNFSALSAELVDEMTDVFQNSALDEASRRQELDEIRELLISNLQKVVQHGKRADSIVKNMLLHAREGSAERRLADVNRLVEESLNLAYHGARAEKAGFNITLKHDLDPEAGALDLYPQEMTRALLNLISNGFYAATKRKAEAAVGDFEPVLSAATKNLGDTLEIRIRDNGSGIPPEVREKMFNPFFTTKPTGEGTGLGLSMTHDIIVKQHGGTIDVQTEPGVFTEFIITLPRGNRI